MAFSHNASLHVCYAVELHNHLEGSITSEIVYSAANRNNVPLPTNCKDQTDLIPYISCIDKNKSSTVLMEKLNFFLPIIADDEQSIRELCISFTKQQYENKIYYSEVRYSPHLLCKNKLSPQQTLIIILDQLKTSSSEYGIIIKSILCCNISLHKKISEIYGFAKKYENDGVVGIDLELKGVVDIDLALKGSNVKFNKTMLDRYYSNITCTIHAETPCPTKMINYIIENSCAKRIGYGYGYSLMNDYELLKKIENKRIHLECYSTSGILSNTAEEDMINLFKQKKISFSVNSDFPAILNVNYLDEVSEILKNTAISKYEISQTWIEATNASFLGQFEKKHVIGEIKKRAKKHFLPMFDVHLIDVGVKREENTKHIYTVYSFKFIIDFENEYVFNARYSALYKLNGLLSNDDDYKSLFNYPLPTFPSKNWWKDYTKKENYIIRAKELLSWFKILISKPGIFGNEIFKKALKILPTENINIYQKLKLMECDECGYFNPSNSNKCKQCNAVKCDACKAFNYMDVEQCQHCGIDKCDACNYFGASVNNCIKCRKPQLIVPIEVRNPFSEKFTIKCAYAASIKIKYLLFKITKYINSKYYPQKYYIDKIHENSFIDYSSDMPITAYMKKRIITKGIIVDINLTKYKHKVMNNDITCKYLKVYASKIPQTTVDDEKKNDGIDYDYGGDDDDNDDSKDENIDNLVTDPLKCPIYKKMMIEYEWTENNLNHLYEFSHFRDEYSEKVKCKYGQTCNAFVRLRDGGNRLDDRCHVKLFNHPPRNRRQIQLSQNVNALIINTKYEQNQGLYKTTDVDKERYGYNEKDGFMNALIEEVINNGFKYDLCLKCNKNCKHKEFSLLSIVDEKLQHIRHKQMGSPLDRGHMLALILYTGCDSNYDLCKSQRNGNYQKWKWFDYCLHHAILFLSQNENGTYKLYSGLNKVKLNKKDVSNGYFPTYTSTSWIKEVAKDFMNNEGMIIQIEKEMRNYFYCCDVSWISKFPDECEILISRSIGGGWGNNSFSLCVLDQQKDVQTVSLDKIEDDNILLTDTFN